MILFDLAMKPLIWGVSAGARMALGAGRAAWRGIGTMATARGMTRRSYLWGMARGAASIASESAVSAVGTAGSYVDAVGSVARPLVLRKDPTSPFGYGMHRYLDDVVLAGLVGVGIYAGMNRGAAVGTVQPGQDLALTGAPMTPRPFRQNIQVNPIDNLSADGSLALALHHLR